jgi:hypothetical protein
MPTKKAPRKETEQLPKKSSVATSTAAAKKRDPAVVPSPPPKKGSNNKTAPSSSLRNQRYASRIQNVSSNPTSSSTEAVAVENSSPLPFQQVVTRLWSKGCVVKQINAVQDESAKKLLTQHIMGLGLRKSSPELNAAAVVTKSPTNSVAAAASTSIYQKNYVDGNSGHSGGKGGNSELYDNVLEVNSSSSNSDENECNANGSKEDDSSFNCLEENESDAASGAKASGAKVDERFAPEGLVYSEDEAYLFEDESEDETRTSFPKDVVRKNIIPGGPTKPDVRNMNEATAKTVLKAYAKERKAYTDKQRFARVKAVQSVSHLSGYSGPNMEQLRTMTDVESNRLEEDHIFVTKEILNLRIAEEANLRCIKFYVSGSYSENAGWTAHIVVCREGDDLLKIPPNQRIDGIDDNDTSPLRTPFKSKWLTPIIQSAVLDSPGVSYGTLREILKQYGNNYALTDSVLQIGRDIMKHQLFGSADVNVKYASAVAATMCALGHEVELVFSTRRQVLTAVSSIVLSEELARRKKLKQSMNGAERKQYVLEWKQEKEVFLNDALGFENGPQYRFLAGILFAPSSSKVIVPHLQDVIRPTEHTLPLASIHYSRRMELLQMVTCPHWR